MVIIIGDSKIQKKYHFGLMYGISDEEYLHRIKNQIPLPPKIILNNFQIIDPHGSFSS